MNTRCLSISLLTCLLYMEVVQAQTIYTWVDEDGVTHFSQTGPADGSQPAETLDIEPPPAPARTPDEDYFSVIRQSQRMHEQRIELEKARAERMAAEAAANQTRTQPYQTEEYESSERYRYPYLAYPYRPHYPVHRYRPGYRPPHYRPPGHKPYRPREGRRSYSNTKRSIGISPSGK